jgi:starch phosphorylase
LADFESYIRCNEEVDALYAQPSQWAEKALLNVARMGWFTSDRSIQDYCEKIWNLERTAVDLDEL